MGCILAVGLLLFIFWILGLTLFSLGVLIHIALALAVILIILWLLKAIFKLF
jgi:hypothetical protein